MRFRESLRGLFVLLAVSGAPLMGVDTPLAQGKPKFLGGAYSGPQAANFLAYWNQVVPENAGKWGSVETTRDVMNWTELDAAYHLAKDNGLPFRFHILVWGNQQPAWIESLSSTEQLGEIEEWFAAVAARYPDIDYLEVVNEPLHDPPNAPGSGGGNYIDALGGAGETGWDWILNAFRMARPLFPNSKLVLNEFSVVNDGNQMANYVAIINLLKAENLVDIVAEQAHSFTVATTLGSTISANLATLAATGLPIMITEMDIDGSDSTTANNDLQLTRYQNVFPLLWEHPSVIGITMWGSRPGLWRPNAVLVLGDNTERSAMQWMRTYVAASNPNLKVFVMAQPANTTEAVGENATFSVGLIGNPAPAIQWQRSIDNGTNWTDLANDATYSGVAGATLTVVVDATMQGHQFRVVANNTIPTSATSAPATLSVPPTISAQPVSTSVTAGGEVTLEVTASGAGPLTYQWRRDGVNLAGATAASYELPSGQFFHAGNYTVIVTGSGGSTTSSAATVTVNPAPPSGSSIRNLSTRGLAQSGDNILIPGFVISGSGTKRLLIRAVGPTLSDEPFKLGDLVAPDMRMTLKRLDTVAEPDVWLDVEANDDWGSNANADTIASTSEMLGAFPLTDPREAVLLMDLGPGLYTIHAGDKDGTSGIAVVELYDADETDTGTRLVNISNRGFCGLGHNVMIPGFTISHEGPKTLLIRVVGPGLVKHFNLSGTMADPRLTVYSGTTPILENDNWGDVSNAATTEQVAGDVFAFSLDPGSNDAAFVVTLQPGSYTVHAGSAVPDGTGIVLVEVYAVN